MLIISAHIIIIVVVVACELLLALFCKWKWVILLLPICICRPSKKSCRFLLLLNLWSYILCLIYSEIPIYCFTFIHPIMLCLISFESSFHLFFLEVESINSSFHAHFFERINILIRVIVVRFHQYFFAFRACRRRVWRRWYGFQHALLLLWFIHLFMLQFSSFSISSCSFFDFVIWRFSLRFLLLSLKVSFVWILQSCALLFS